MANKTERTFCAFWSWDKEKMSKDQEWPEVRRVWGESNDFLVILGLCLMNTN